MNTGARIPHRALQCCLLWAQGDERVQSQSQKSLLGSSSCSQPLLQQQEPSILCTLSLPCEAALRAEPYPCTSGSRWASSQAGFPPAKSAGDAWEWKRRISGSPGDISFHSSNARKCMDPSHRHCRLLRRCVQTWGSCSGEIFLNFHSANMPGMFLRGMCHGKETPSAPCQQFMAKCFPEWPLGNLAFDFIFIFNRS